MNRSCTRIWVILSIVLGLTAWAQARHPTIQQMDLVDRLARRVSQDAEILVRVAREERHHFTGREQEAIERFADLRRASRQFERQVSQYHQDPGQTESDFRDLRRAYREAQRYFDDIHGTEPVERAISRVQDSMRDLVGYYGDEGGPGYGDRGQLRSISLEIERLADRLEERAENAHQRGRVGKSEVKRFDRLNDVAKEFVREVREENANPENLGEEYGKLVDRMREANEVAGSFGGNFQSEFDQLRQLVRQLDYIRSYNRSDDRSEHRGWRWGGYGRH